MHLRPFPPRRHRIPSRRFLQVLLDPLSLSGLVDPSSARSTGRDAVAVQVGDVLDRGDDELRLLYHFHRLKLGASRAGGALHILHGNHEIMNAQGDFSYVTRAGLDEFKRWAFWYRSGVARMRLYASLDSPRDPFKGIPKSFHGIKEEFWEGFRARIAALRPSGPIAVRFLAGNQTALSIGESVFVHGDLLQKHVDHGLEKINEEVREWIMGLSGGRSPPPCLRGLEGLVWLRKFSRSDCDCSHLEEVLAMIPGARRMVMGHAIQEQGISEVCGARAIRIDVGLSRGCANALPEVLEVYDGVKWRILKLDPVQNERWKQDRGRLLWPAAKKELEGLRILVPETGPQEVEVKVFLLRSPSFTADGIRKRSIAICSS
ncbi:hypothetical protein ZIOFF_064716 [Zingiber officinale]|uniref:Calcineurin-like phosphoesterase domain-containing protein n=1 Tax=Zingiber officinale TaxID=94328 RepID=A0A8J5EW96_ZINOF|nr:hypothetical protein ZIOFF_064716 [Zingiber officinale]